MNHPLVALALSGYGRQALKAAAAFGIALVCALAFVISSVVALLSGSAPNGTIGSAGVAEIPSEQLIAIQTAAASCGLPWQVLAGVARTESDFGRDMSTSSAGAIGYGQFLPSTWAAYGDGGDPYRYEDALPAMARYLCANGGAGDVRGALYAYNHADWYVARVTAVAVKYGYLAPGSSATRVVDLARSQSGKPYVWGGSTPQTSFDCSGLVQWAFGQTGVQLPRTAQEQFLATARILPSEAHPGDLLFFADTYDTTDYITHVGIYVGAGQMIDAQSDGIRQVDAFTGYWAKHLAGAGRIGGAL